MEVSKDGDSIDCSNNDNLCSSSSDDADNDKNRSDQVMDTNVDFDWGTDAPKPQTSTHKMVIKILLHC